MRKVIMTLCFNRPEQIQKSIDRLENTQDTTGYEKVLVDCSYPIPDKLDNSVILSALAKRHGYDVIKPFKNRGVSENWMWAAKELELNSGDFLIGMDPDSEPIEKGWCDAIVDVLLNDPDIAYCGLTKSSPPELETEVDESSIAYTLHNYAGRWARVYSQPVAWPMGGFSVKFLNEVGLMQSRSHYGFIEIATMELMRGTEWYWVMLDEFHDQTRDRGEEIYRKWKVLQARGHLDGVDFEQFIEGEKQK